METAILIKDLILSSRIPMGPDDGKFISLDGFLVSGKGWDRLVIDLPEHPDLAGLVEQVREVYPDIEVIGIGPHGDITLLGMARDLGITAMGRSEFLRG